jgi:predicted DNA-binding transcriptional regulator AlpA
VSDRWPHMMKRTTAAQYCDLSDGAFIREVAAGRLPSPVKLGGREHWFRPALDKALAMIAGDLAMDYETEFWNRDAAA